MPFLSYSGGRGGRGRGRGRGHAGSGFRRKPAYPRRPPPQRQWTRSTDAASRKTGGYSWKREETSTSVGEETPVPIDDASVESKTTAPNDTHPTVAHTEKLVHVPPSSSEASSHTTGSNTARTICKYSKTNRNIPFLAAGVKRPRPSGSATAPTTAITSTKSTVKRILLETDTKDQAKDETKDESNESSEIHTDTQTAKKKKTLTDFAYRQVQHGRRLVRVNNAKAPICPTFMKGLACTDETCRMRHDAEAIPVCFFFQRQGMCLKQETCPFRHVKVPRQRQRQQRAHTKR